MKPPRVLLADDHALLLDAFRKLLEPQCEIVGAVADGRALIEAAERLRPEDIVADISMPRLNGLDACAQLRVTVPDARLIFKRAGRILHREVARCFSVTWMSLAWERAHHYPSCPMRVSVPTLSSPRL